MKPVRIGGQAVMEGVMMKNSDRYAIAVRKPDQTIEVKVTEYKGYGEKNALLRLPIVRGVVNFVESLTIGLKTLSFSASFFEEEEKDAIDKVFHEKADSVRIGATVVLSLVLAIALFMLLPALLAGLLEKVTDSFLLLAIAEGVIRLAIFLLYIIGISQISDIKRVFMYHGAEHKTINCLEAGEELTPENVKRFSRYHKRCGTSFLFFVMIISIVVFMFIHVDQTILRMVYRILLVPVIAGISYEVIRFAGNHDTGIMRILSYPGMMLQRLTTKEPDLDMIEVAIQSVEGVMDWQEYVIAVQNGEIDDNKKRSGRRNKET